MGVARYLEFLKNSTSGVRGTVQRRRVFGCVFLFSQNSSVFVFVAEVLDSNAGPYLVVAVVARVAAAQRCIGCPGRTAPYFFVFFGAGGNTSRKNTRP